MDDTASDTESMRAQQTFRQHEGADSRIENAQSGGSGPTGRSALASVIEGEIIPRLLLAHYENSCRESSVASEIHFDDPSVLQECSKEVLRGSADKVSQELRRLQNAGIVSEETYCVLFAPLFRNIIEVYEDKRCSFEEMILGISLLDRLLRDDGLGDALVDSEWPEIQTLPPPASPES